MWREGGGKWFAGVDSAGDEDAVDPLPRRTQHVGGERVADRDDGRYVGIAGQAEGVLVDGGMRLAIPQDGAAKPFVQVGNCRASKVWVILPSTVFGRLSRSNTTFLTKQSHLTYTVRSFGSLLPPQPLEIKRQLLVTPDRHKIDG